MRELGELYRVYYGDGCDDRALDYMLYVVDREKKYPIEHLLKSVQEHTEKKLGFYFYEYMYFFFIQLCLGMKGRAFHRT